MVGGGDDERQPNFISTTHGMKGAKAQTNKNPWQPRNYLIKNIIIGESPKFYALRYPSCPPTACINSSIVPEYPFGSDNHNLVDSGWQGATGRLQAH